MTGRAAYHIRGTRSAGEAYDEMVGGRDAIAELGAPAPRFYQEIARVVKPKTKVTIVD